MDYAALVEEIKKVIAESFSAENESTIREQLEAKFNELSSVVSSLNSKVVDLEAEKTTLLNNVEALEVDAVSKKEVFDSMASENEQLKKDKEELLKTKEDLEKANNENLAKLADIEKKERSRIRLSTLESEGLLIEGTLHEKQEKNAYDMSDEEFALYKEELVAMKAAFATKVAPETAAVPPADINKGKESVTNVLPVNPVSGDVSRVKEIGEALVKLMSERRKISGDN